MSIRLKRTAFASGIRWLMAGLFIACSSTHATTSSLVVSPEIVGGVPSSTPWAVDIYGSVGGCSGIAISPEWVITAWHCAKVTVVAFSDEGVSSDRYIDSPSGDVKLVHLSKPHPLAAYPQLDLNYVLHANDVGTIYGSGKPGWDSRQATVNVLGAGNDYIGGPAIHVQGVNGAAQSGDSGGPLLINGKVVGVDSTGLGDDIHAESWYANLTGSKDFISSVLVGTPTLEGGSVSVALGREFFYSKQRIMIWVNGRYAAETYNGAPYYAYAEPTDSGVTLHLGSGVKAGDYVQVGIVSGVPGNTPPSPSSAQMLAYAYLDAVRSVTLADGRANAELGSWLFKSNQRVMFWINGQYAGETYQGVAYYASATFDSLGIRPYAIGSQTSEGVVIRPGTAVKDGDEIQIGIVPGVPGNSPPPPSSAQVLAKVAL